MKNELLDRSIRFFGVDGQKRLEGASVVVAGVGGLGSFAVLEAALLRVGQVRLFDPGQLKTSNRNRYVTACHDDLIPGTLKVDIGRRLVHQIAPHIDVQSFPESIISENGLSAIKEADVVVGCLDTEGIRLLLLQACASMRTQYIDLATEIIPDEKQLRYGGRVCSSFFGEGCLSCLDAIDREEASLQLAGKLERAQRQAIYGVDQKFLADSGPSIGPLNGIVASAGIFELMVHLSGIRAPQPYLNYNGRSGKMSLRTERLDDTCYFCEGLFAGQQMFDVSELLHIPQFVVGEPR